MLNRLRPQVKVILDPVAKKIRINPNILTIIGLLVSVISAYMFATGNLLIGGLLIALSGFVDMLDGAVARNNYQTTKFGGLLDSTADRFADAFILIGIIYGGYVNWIYGILALHASLTVSYVRARAESEGIKCNVGIAERAERLVIIMIGAFLSYFTNIQIFNMNLLGIAVVVIMILGYVTVIQRVYHSWKTLKED
ncbi:MAG: CDP-alcohol phosphatidyltransferase family protein [Methanobacterium sp. ERen5]|nr:MAG: CDP-alcohol phosphatidyltransferase family protein [Methanobacterium sp. ERen5]